MRAEVRSELEKLHTMQPQEADKYIARIIEENFEMRARLDETANASGEMARKSIIIGVYSPANNHAMLYLSQNTPGGILWIKQH